jgi:hypothetical protein
MKFKDNHTLSREQSVFILFSPVVKLQERRQGNLPLLK